MLNCECSRLLATMGSAGVLLILLSGGGIVYAVPPLERRSCQELYYAEQVVDHFSWSSTDTAASLWPQRYFLDKSHWKRQDAPIFFYGRLSDPVAVRYDSTVCSETILSTSLDDAACSELS